jgi:hypothetical protein
MIQESKEQQQIYNIFRNTIYMVLVIELFMNMPFGLGNPIGAFAYRVLSAFHVFNTVLTCKAIELVCIGVTCIGTTARKAVRFNWNTMVICPLALGFVFMIACVLFQKGSWGSCVAGFPLNRVLYLITSICGTMLVHQGLDAIAKFFSNKMDQDRFNFENESFQQSEKLVDNAYSVNIPMIYYFKGKMHKGWINVINPFRGSWVVGTPGSGKTFSVIEPFIRQHSAKGFAMVIYDYKFPTLAEMAFYHYCKNKKYGHLPQGCKFNIINFTDVEYSNRVNPIQKKYIPDLSAASETAATLLAALNKGGEKSGGSDKFFQNSAENFLAAIIYFFINFHPVGWKNGKKLKHFVVSNGRKLQLHYKMWNDIIAVDEDRNVILDFTEGSKLSHERNVSIDEDGIPVDLKGLSYIDHDDNVVMIDDAFYEDDEGNQVEPDTYSGEYSDMPHVLSFLGKSYEDVFVILMDDPAIMSLMAPFKSAFDNKAMEQLEGMVGTLRVNAARLVSQEAYWAFSGDDFDLKVSDPKNPSYLIIANDPEKEQVIGSLNALILNRLTTRVNSGQGKNIPVSIIIDELPTLYFHKIDRLIGTARSNKVSVTMGFQELPQLEADYGKNGMQKVITVCGNVFSGAARNKETLEWLQNDIFGKVKQTSQSISINDDKISTTINEMMDNLVPGSKIADMATGWICGQTARDFTPTDKNAMQHVNLEETEEFRTTKFFAKTDFDMDHINEEKKHYIPLPKKYVFKSEREKEALLNRNFKRINEEVDSMISELLGKK